MEELLKFKEEVHNMETADILLILEDQLDLYSEEEIQILKDEFSNRSTSSSDIEASQERIALKCAEEAEKQEKEQRKKEIERLKNIRNNKIKTLAQNGVDSYYEYTSLTIVDDYSGSFDIEHTISKINELALEGWRLKATITNEIGKNSSQFGVGGFSSGTNATIEQTTFILERKIAIHKN